MFRARKERQWSTVKLELWADALFGKVALAMSGRRLVFPTATTLSDRPEEDTMLHKSRNEKVKKALNDAMSYAGEMAEDDELRDALRSAVTHGTLAMRRLRDDSRVVGVSSRLADDREFRRSLQAALDDLERAAKRARNRSTHRLRKALLVLSGGVAIVAAVPAARAWHDRAARGPAADSTSALL
jgi:hypothetical protein